MSQEPMLIENKPHEEQAEHVHHSHGAPHWSGFAAVIAACFAALAALTSLLAGHHADHGMEAQLNAADKWSQYQAKSIKQNLVESKLDILAAIGKEQPATSPERANIARYDQEKEKLRDEAKELESEARTHNAVHGKLAIAIGFCQVAIAICAVALLTKRKPFMYLGLLLGLSGVGFFAMAILRGMH